MSVAPLTELGDLGDLGEPVIPEDRFWPAVAIPADPETAARLPLGLTVPQAAYLLLTAVGVGLCLTGAAVGVACGAPLALLGLAAGSLALRGCAPAATVGGAGRYLARRLAAGPGRASWPD